MSQDKITITRHADGATMEASFFWGGRSVDVGGYREMALCPAFDAEDAEEMQSFADWDIAEQVAYLFIDGHGISKYEDDAFSWVLSFEEV